MKKLWFAAILSAAFAAVAAGQAARPGVKQPVVTARFIPDSVAIGDRFVLRIEVTKDLMQQIGFPQSDSAGRMSEHIELVKERPIDTVKTENRRITIGKEYVLTTFQAGVHYFTGIPVLFIDKNITDTIYARPDSIALQVGTFDIDTLKQDIYDIKPTLDMPLKPGEVSGYALAGLLAAALIAALAWVYLRWRRNRPIFGRPRQDDPPHVAAIKALEALQHQKLWQNGRHKLYYTLLADIVRTYIQGRYGVAAMEMTTEELLAAMGGLGIPERNLAGLASMLRTADLAKFAKYAPPAEDNEMCYADSYHFVEDTKPAVEAPADNEE